MSLLKELKRRNVFKVGIAYVIMAWLVLQVADVILNNITAPGWIFHVLLLFLAIGLPFAVFFAWAFELTPEGLKRESEVDRSQSITPQTGEKLNLMITVVLALALGYFAYDKFVLSADRETAAIESAMEQAEQASSRTATETAMTTAGSNQSDHSIAVLPFVNMSDDASNEYFSDGLSEELLNLLAKIPELRVTSRSSAFSYKGKDFKIADVGRELNVAHVLEGSVRKAGNQVRITAQLIQVDSDTHLWSETYDRSLDNIFAIQDEISAAVVDSLKLTLLGEAPRANVVNADAYALVLQGRYFFNQRGRENYEKAATAFDQALTIDPDYALAWSSLALTYFWQANFGYIDAIAGRTLGLAAVERSLELNPNLADAWATESLIRRVYDWDWAGADLATRKSLQLELNSSNVLNGAGNLAATLGRFNEAIDLYRQAIAIDPLNQQALYYLARAFTYSGELDEAETYTRKLLTLNPGYPNGHQNLAQILLLKGQPELALAEIELEREQVWHSWGKAKVLLALNRHEEADAALAAWIEDYSNGAAFQIAELYGLRGEIDSAFEWLERAYVQKDGGISQMLGDPLLANLTGDPRWQPFLEKVGLLAYWQEM